MTNTTKSLNLSTFTAPKDFLKMYARAFPEFKLEPGMTLDFQAMGNPPHPTHGPIPPITVESLTANGGIEVGYFQCTGKDKDGTACTELVEVHGGDIFQKRRCPKCQKRLQNLHKKGIRSPEDAAAKQAEREAKAAQREVEKLEKKIADAKARQEKVVASSEEQLKKLEEKKALIAAETERQRAQGVQVAEPKGEAQSA